MKSPPASSLQLLAYRPASSRSLEWLFQTQAHGISLGLAPMRRLLEALGNPEKKLQCLHVAGTNGKGSVSAIMESILRAAGYRTGLYTSPHLVHFKERIRLSGIPVDDVLLEQGIQRLQQATEGWKQLPTFFELTTALAFDLFARSGRHVVVLETGLGGRLDATNLAPNKLACAITPISLDHQEYLGSTLQEIAREKAGIFLPGVPVVSAPQSWKVASVLKEEAKKIGVPFTMITEPLPPEIPLGLVGSYQRWNAALALAALRSTTLNILPEAEAKGLVSVSWPGRFQRFLLEDRFLILDGAHNPAAIEQLLQTWREEFAEEKCWLIFGALADKEWKPMLTSLQTIASEILLVPVASPRTVLPQKMLPHFPAATAFISLAEALQGIMSKKKEKSLIKNSVPNAPILLAGSLFLIGEALALLQGEAYRLSRQ